MIKAIDWDIVNIKIDTEKQNWCNFLCNFFAKLHVRYMYQMYASRMLRKTAPVAEWLRSLTSVLLIIRSSHRCGFPPRTGHEFICETSHVLLAGVSGGFSPGTPVFAPPTD